MTAKKRRSKQTDRAAKRRTNDDAEKDRRDDLTQTAGEQKIDDGAQPPLMDETGGGVAEEPAPGAESSTAEAVTAGEDPAEPEQTPQQHLQQELELLNDRHLRVLADYNNFKRRTGRELAETRRRGMEHSVLRLLPVLDDLERLLDQDHEKMDLETLLAGMRLLAEKFRAELGTLGIQAFDSVDRDFDPEQHEALSTLSDPEKEDGVVLQEFLRGYRLADRVLRHSQVIVNKK